MHRELSGCSFCCIHSATKPGSLRPADQRTVVNYSAHPTIQNIPGGQVIFDDGLVMKPAPNCSTLMSGAIVRHHTWLALLAHRQDCWLQHYWRRRVCWMSGVALTGFGSAPLVWPENIGCCVTCNRQVCSALPVAALAQRYLLLFYSGSLLLSISRTVITGLADSIWCHC